MDLLIILAAKDPDSILGDACKADPSAYGCAGETAFTAVQSILNTLIFVVGAIAVIVVIIGGLRYVLSAGNSESTKGAKNTVLYALIGVVVAIMAYAAVNFVAKLF